MLAVTTAAFARMGLILFSAGWSPTQSRSC